MKIDLHVHSSERSACGQVGEEAQIQAAIATGLDAIAFTDHQRLIPEYRLSFLQQEYAPFRIFNGIEISLGEDFLVIGSNSRELETDSWSYPELHAFVREQGGYMVLAHPFRYHPALHEDIERFPPDGIEIHLMDRFLFN